jgi:hypothetical protein
MEEASMSEVSIIGLDIAKRVFHAHDADALGGTVFSRRITRGKLLAFFASQPRCLVALEACGGAHHCAREFMRMGPEVRLIAGLRKALRQAAEERWRRCRSDLQGGAALDHAVRRDQERGAAGLGAGVPDPATSWSGSAPS